MGSWYGPVQSVCVRSLEPLRSYAGEDVRLSLPGGRTVFDVDWLAVYDVTRGAALASVLVPDQLNVPPADTHLHDHRLPDGRTVFDVDWLAVYDVTRGATLASVLVPDQLNVPPADTHLHDHRSALPHCKQLHRDLQVSWEVFGNQVTFQLAGMVAEDEYMAWGVSGSSSRSQMLGADVAVTSFDPALQRGLATDYNITALTPCVMVLGAWRGVCRDERVAGQDNNQVFTAGRAAGLTTVTYRRQLAPAEDMDRAWPTERDVFAVWAVGGLDAARDPAYHRLFPRRDVRLRLAADPPTDDCVPFAMPKARSVSGWERAQLFDPALRVFSFRVGEAGGARGLAARRRAAPRLAWYVNGQLAPDLQLRRGLTYTAQVWGGDDPHSADLYHPLVVTDEPRGGLERLTDAEQRRVRVLAGARHTLRGRLAPLVAGPACPALLAPNAGADLRRDAWDTFRSFNRSLRWTCEGEAAARPAQLVFTPNSTWPDIVYYNSFTHSDMGGRIFVVDRHRRPSRAAAPSPAAARSLVGALALSLALNILL
ncbi:protein Skeletor, isoforms B/C-like [Leptidea sinapis]|uniref:protein Skeletor, isoforms B/C-like n=1 Tax=Leptidea sinapis TaxID=189913 RepID=UPI0021C4ACDA|nr:protein Skeletor, isoforms B/C-like [Leptidea sinapis]